METSEKDWPSKLTASPSRLLITTATRCSSAPPSPRVKVKNLLSGSVTEKTFQAYETSFTPADVDSADAQYLYYDGEFYNFMDMETYDQHQLTQDQLGDGLNYLKEEITLEISFYKGAIIGVKLPTFVDLVVTYSPPGLRGDTAQGGTKPATLETGHTLNVPLFVNEGQTIKVDTRNGQYVERVT